MFRDDREQEMERDAEYDSDVEESQEREDTINSEIEVGGEEFDVQLNYSE